MNVEVASFARTVLGDIAPGALGVCYSHEHLLISPSLTTRRDPDLRLDDIDVMAGEVAQFKSLGGQTLVDMMPGGIGREPTGLRTLSERCGVHVIATTGFHLEKYYDESHWLYHYSVEEISDLFAREITDGMDRFGYRGPIVDRMSARAGVIKCATDYYRWTGLTEKWFEAAAMAAVRTGASISTHTEYGSLALQQIDRLIGFGVPLDSIIIGHVDKNPDLGLHRELAATGVFLEYDGASRVKYHPDSAIIALLAQAAELSYDRQILLGTDLARRSYYPSYGGGPGLAYLMSTFMPRLRDEGFGDLQQKVLVDNPARAFCFASVR